MIGLCDLGVLVASKVQIMFFWDLVHLFEWLRWSFCQIFSVKVMVRFCQKIWHPSNKLHDVTKQNVTVLSSAYFKWVILLTYTENPGAKNKKFLSSGLNISVAKGRYGKADVRSPCKNVSRRL